MSPRRRLAALARHTAAAPGSATAAAEGQQQAVGLTEVERYWFDTQGMVVIPRVLSDAQVQACTAALEANRDSVSYTPLSEDGRGWVVPPPLAGASGRPGRSQLSRCMELPAPWCRTFREIFLHPKVLGCMQDMIGNGFRGTEGRILMQTQGGEGHALHGGGTSRSATEEHTTLTLGGNMSLFQNGELWNSVMSVQFALAPCGEGDGGFCAIPGPTEAIPKPRRAQDWLTGWLLAGSHKSNYECPAELRDCAIAAPGMVQPVLAPGDMLLFTEASLPLLVRCQLALTAGAVGSGADARNAAMDSCARASHSVLPVRDGGARRGHGDPQAGGARGVPSCGGPNKRPEPEAAVVAGRVV